MRFARNDRGLTSQEKATAFSVFLNTMDYDLVRITDGLGGGDRPFTFPGAPLSATGIAGRLLDGPIGSILDDLIIYINFGPVGYANGLSDAKTFVHEMTHAWQYMHGIHVALDSISNQARHGDKAYDYDKPATLSWNSYNVEQQAEIVADWYEAAHASGASPASNIQHSNYKYIRDNIRANKPK